MKDLHHLSPREIKDIFDSVDTILTDVDGVLYEVLQPIPGSSEAVKSLKEIGKKIYYVSNNSTQSLEKYHQRLSLQIELSQDDIAIPLLAMIDYLKSINFEKSIYLIGLASSIKAELEKNGFTVVKSEMNPIEESAQALIQNIKPDSNIGAVIVDYDFNFNYIAAQMASMYLKNPKTLFIIGGSDKRISIGKKGVYLIGPGYFQGLLMEDSGRKPDKQFSKPYQEYNDFITKKFQITDPQRVLFIGDSINEDMGFATNFGYKKLLVLTGNTSKEDLKNWPNKEEYKPDYYVDKFSSLTEIIAKSYDI